MSKHEDWINDVSTVCTVGDGWCVRVDGCDVFEPVNNYGTKGRKTFSIASGLESEEEATKVAREWLLEQLSNLSGTDELTRLTEIAAAKTTRCDELFEELERVAPDSPLLEKIRNEMV